MNNLELPKDWIAWAIIGAAIFLALLATDHPATAFTGLFFVLFIFILKLLVDSRFSSRPLVFVAIFLFVLLAILGLKYVPAEWQAQEQIEASTQSLAILLLH
jgi:uncharacterized membrane protein YjdF